MEGVANRSVALLTVYNNTFNATHNATGAPVGTSSLSDMLPQLSCDEAAVEVLRSILFTCATVFVIMLVVLCTLVAALMLQIRKLGVLIRSLRAATGSSAVEVCSGLLTAPELRSSFQSKAKKGTKKTAKFTDPQDTACSAPRDVDEEEL
jgi:hypothetical protein